MSARAGEPSRAVANGASEKPAATAATTIRPVRAELLGLSRQRIAVVTIIADDELPEIIMFNGDPFLLDRNLLGVAYRQVRPFRADIGGA